MKILSIDIGGTGLKAAVLNEDGTLCSEHVKTLTPRPCLPEALLAAIVELVRPMPAYDRISIGFPGVVRDGRVVTAPNLDTALWAGFPLCSALTEKLGGHPARMLNDADMQGYALISGRGLELVITLGTGVGTALYRDGALMPHMELSQHPLRRGRTYDQYLGDAEFRRIGKQRWNKRLGEALEILKVLLRPDRIILTGGNAKDVEADPSAELLVVPGIDGIQGGARLWLAVDPEQNCA